MIFFTTQPYIIGLVSHYTALLSYQDVMTHTHTHTHTHTPIVPIRHISVLARSIV